MATDPTRLCPVPARPESVRNAAASPPNLRRETGFLNSNTASIGLPICLILKRRMFLNPGTLQNYESQKTSWFRSQSSDGFDSECWAGWVVPGRASC